MKSINQDHFDFLIYLQEQALPAPKWDLGRFPISIAPVRSATPLSKEIFDLFFSALGIIISLPLWLFIAFSIWLEDGTPVFYRQARVGKNGRIFYALKFRTMQPNAEEGLGPVQAFKNDPRVTRVGKFLRQTALDELPQLWNIFKREMSFVGPRPLRPGEILANRRGEQIKLEEIPGFYDRSRVIPGLTGLAQVFAPRDIHHKQKFRYDRIYINKWSFLLDLKLIVLSFLRTFTGRWEA